jgi:GH24 family phage-related lysozyme (muramidase)
MKKIIGTVGYKGKNNISDVKVVQGLLNQHKLIGFPIPLKIDGKSGPNTVKRIEALQKSNLKMIRPDGLVDINDKTFKQLVATKVGAKSGVSMFLGQKGINLLKSSEELAITPYDDQTGKDITIWIEGATIGYGHLIAKSNWSKYKYGLTEAEALALFKADLSPFVNTVKNKVKVGVTQNEFDALVILAFNIGEAGFSSSSVLKMVNNPLATTSYATLEKAWKAWDKSQGKVSRGLINRRQSEWNIYNKGVYVKW